MSRVASIRRLLQSDPLRPPAGRRRSLRAPRPRPRPLRSGGAPAAQAGRGPGARASPVRRWRRSPWREHPRFEVSRRRDRAKRAVVHGRHRRALAQTAGDLFLLIGSETFLDLPTWREPETVARRARLVVVPRTRQRVRPGQPAARKVLALLGLARFAGPDEAGASAQRRGTRASRSAIPLLVRAVSLPISASDLRRRAREGRSLAYRVPPSVAAYIARHGLYRAGA